jgi:predicted DNA-binding protein YlxM (UPF0122 family)
MEIKPKELIEAPDSLDTLAENELLQKYDYYIKARSFAEAHKILFLDEFTEVDKEELERLTEEIAQECRIFLINAYRRGTLEDKTENEIKLFIYNIVYYKIKSFEQETIFLEDQTPTNNTRAIDPFENAAIELFIENTRAAISILIQESKIKEKNKYREFLRLILIEGLSMSETAKRLKVERQRVYQIKDAILKLTTDENLGSILDIEKLRAVGINPEYIDLYNLIICHPEKIRKVIARRKHSSNLYTRAA